MFFPNHRSSFIISHWWLASFGLLLVFAGGFTGTAVAADPTFEQVLPAMETRAILEHGDKVLCGLDGGGVLVWDRNNLQMPVRWTSGKDLSGNSITDMTWTGQYVWIATRGAGMTRVGNLDSSPSFRQYSSNLGSLDISAVTGAVIGESERVFYGMFGEGLGQINSGLSGNVYTADQDGLISDDITALQMYDGDLFVGTTAGISRFANNEFTDQNSGLTNLVIMDLVLDSEGNLLAANGNEVFRWDPVGEIWVSLGLPGVLVVELASSAAAVYALGRTEDGYPLLSEFDGATWSPIVTPYPLGTAIAAGEDFWIGGPVVESTAGGSLTYNYLGRRLTGGDFETVTQMGTQAANCEGVTFDPEGRVWMGDWFGSSISRYDPRDDSFFFIYERPHPGNETLNLFPGLGPLLSMAAGSDGTVYAGQYAGGGLLKFNPSTVTTDLIDPDNSPMGGRAIIGLVVHPDGPVIVLHDRFDDPKVEVLVDPDNWSQATSWMLPPMDQGLGDGLAVFDAVVESRDVIWFSVEELGLLRWDVNGPAAGPSDPITWFDESDDVWYQPITSFLPATALDPGQALGLAVGADGSLWAGGNGLVQFTYALGSQNSVLTDVHLALQEKFSATTIGLVNGNVKDIAVDANGDVWAATRTGLNRITPLGNETTVDTWIDLPNYLSNSIYGVLYSPNVIAPLPGNTYARIVPSFNGRQMLLSSDQGTTVITVGSGTVTDPGSDPLQNVYCYPNPWTPGQEAPQLKLGGLPDGTVQVEIYNTEGQQVFVDNSVAEGTGFWEGDNKLGSRVTSGMYVLKISTGNMITTRILGVVR